MVLQISIPLCEYGGDALGSQSLSAVNDDLTLTYCVLAHESRVLLGHLYGPGSTYADGATTAQIRKGKLPIVVAGGAIFSFIYADDAATAIVAAVDRDLCDVLNIVDHDPAPVREWLPEVARMLDAPDPRHVPPWGRPGWPPARPARAA